MTISRPRRAERRQQRSASPLLRLPFRLLRNPQPPYTLLDPEQLEAIHLASLEILETVGVDFLDTEALSIWAKAGAKVDYKAQHVWLDRELVLAAVAQAPKLFTWRAPNPAHNVIIGGDFITFGPCGGMVFVSDLDRGRRAGTLADFENFLKLAQMCPLLHFATWEQVTANDVPVNVRHLRRLYASLTLTDKPIMEAAHGREIPGDCLAMMRLVMGDANGNLPADPVIGDVINVNSPLRYDNRMLGGLITYARAGQVTFITPFILAGAMSPISMAAALAQQNAEVLAGVALTQLVRPGAPVLYGGFTTNVDMRSGGPTFGTPEGAWAALVGAQLARRYGLPYRGNGGLTNTKIADAQAGYETLWNLWPAILGHTNLVMHSAGWLEGGLTASYEKFMIDVENLAMFYHFLDGFAVNHETLALEMIAAVGPGGHHFGTAHTQARFATEFYQSALSDRQNYESWQAAGAQDTLQRANSLWKSWLTQYEPPGLDIAKQEALQDYIARRERELVGKNLYEM